MKRTNKIILFILVLALLLPSMVSAKSETDAYNADTAFFNDILNLIKERYPFEVDQDSLVKTAVKAMLQSLDPYSDYYTKEEADRMFQSLEGNFTGIGVYIEIKDGLIHVNQTIKDQPAEKAGVKEGDFIVSVNDQDIRGISLDEASSLIKGPVGTSVILGIQRGEETIYLNVVRAKIEIKNVEVEIIDNKIGHIILKEFNSGSSKEIKKALDDLDKKKISRVILDLRNNPGGLLDEAVSIGKLIIPKGPIVYLRDKSNKLTTYNSTLSNTKYKLVVLVNGNSASASEIIAGAVKDTKAGTLVGTTTFGKALVQSLIRVNDGSVVKITSSVYLTPNKNLINGLGIEPNYIIENEDGKDLQLKKAIELLK